MSAFRCPARGFAERFAITDLEARASQDDQLMSERRILRLKPALRLERRGQYGQNEADQRNHRANLADSISR